ncbi:MAG: alpha-rhamnosidase [Acidimicrobiales bacterium]|nr:MAG: alpha-rhamnosidase [Acidimicrobiales bacterium]
MPPATYFRKDFTVSGPVEAARLYSTSAGYSEFYLSGEKIGDRIFNPAQTDFDKRIYYDVDDITDRLSVGPHTLAFHLGNGFYGERTAFGRDDLFYGEPAAIAQLEIRYKDGTQQLIASDESWTAHPSPIVKNGVYSGEVYDARRELNGWAKPALREDSEWQSVSVLEDAPTKHLVAAEMPPVRRVTEVAPIAILNPAPGIWTVDFGQNFTGVPAIDVSRFDLERDQTVLFRYAEWADKNGNVGMKSGGAAPRTKQVDAYISNGNDTLPWSPTFTWHGFRYMEISGLSEAPPLEAFSAHLTRTDIPRIGQFTSSSELLNRIHDTALWSFEANLVSVPSDCPIRERNGWTGDAHATVRMASYNYQMAPFLEKYLGDFKTTEMIAPTIVPGRRTRSGMIDWAAAEVLLTWEHFIHSGDASVIKRQYDSLLEYVAYVETVADGDLFTNSKHFYGDWCDTLPELGKARPLGRCMSYHTPGEVTATALMVRVFDLMAKMAVRIDRDVDSETFSSRRDAIKSAFHTAYFDPNVGGYGSQTANAMALSFGIAPEDVIDQVAASLDTDVREIWDGHSSVGALGQTWLYPALSEHGYEDTALGVFTAPGATGYSYLFDVLDATTLWEDHTKFIPGEGAVPGKSLNHPFHGGYDAWFYTGLGGIKPDPDMPGYKHFVLSPVFPEGLNSVSVELETGYGLIRSAWTREGEEISWTFNVPPNTQATVKPHPMSQSKQKVGSGKYTFILTTDGKMRSIVETPYIKEEKSHELQKKISNWFCADYTGFCNGVWAERSRERCIGNDARKRSSQYRLDHC